MPQCGVTGIITEVCLKCGANTKGGLISCFYPEGGSWHLKCVCRDKQYGCLARERKEGPFNQGSFISGPCEKEHTASYQPQGQEAACSPHYLQHKCSLNLKVS